MTIEKHNSEEEARRLRLEAGLDSEDDGEDDNGDNNDESDKNQGMVEAVVLHPDRVPMKYCPGIILEFSHFNRSDSLICISLEHKFCGN